MRLESVSVTAVKWTPAKHDSDGEEKTPCRAVISLEIEAPDPDELAELLRFAQSGPCAWTVAGLQAQMAVRG